MSYVPERTGGSLCRKDGVQIVEVAASAKPRLLVVYHAILDVFWRLATSSIFDPSAIAMQITEIAFGTTDWAAIPPTEHPGETGTALWRTREFGRIRVRMVEYSPGYRADHWCEKGHILLCLAGDLETELRDGRRFQLRPGISYQVADGAEAHRSYSRTGATLFIVD